MISRDIGAACRNCTHHGRGHIGAAYFTEPQGYSIRGIGRGTTAEEEEQAITGWLDDVRQLAGRWLSGQGAPNPPIPQQKHPAWLFAAGAAVVALLVLK